MLTVSNYDYVTDYVFHLTGTFEGKVSFTGELYAGVEVPWFSARQATYGTQVTGAMRMGALHNHFVTWKIDFDIGGPADNSVMWTEVVPDGLRQGALKVNRWFPKTETEAFWKMNGSRPLHYMIVNEKKGYYGNIGGYLVKPFQSVNIPVPDYEIYAGPAAWSKYKIATTVFKYGELDVTLPRDNKYAKKPAVDLDNYIEDDEPIRHQDLVSWISDGIWHIPFIEDFPLTVPIGNTLGFMVKPGNLFPEDPSMDLSNAIGGQPQDPGMCAVVRYPLDA